MGLGEGHEGDDVGFHVVHQGRQLGKPGLELIGDLPPDLRRRGLIILREHRPDRSRNHLMLSFGYIGQSIALEVNPTALPRRFEHLGDGGLQSFVRVRDDELHPLEAALLQAAQEAEPARGDGKGGERIAERRTAMLCPCLGETGSIQPRIGLFLAVQCS